MSTPGQLTQLGDPNAVVCDGDSCVVPGLSASDDQAGTSGSVMSATTAPKADSSESASTKAL
jgi:hypothetical protein